MIAIIAGLTPERVIGKNGTLPWDIPEDLKVFREKTKGSAVIMGRKTYESIGKPLPQRENFVVSSTMDPKEGIHVCRSLDQAVKEASTYSLPIFIIGGSGMYKAGLAFVDELYLSHIHKSYDGDTYFPEFNEDDWKVVEQQEYDQFTFKRYQRK